LKRSDCSYACGETKRERGREMDLERERERKQERRGRDWIGRRKVGTRVRE